MSTRCIVHFSLCCTVEAEKCRSKNILETFCKHWQNYENDLHQEKADLNSISFYKQVQVFHIISKLCKYPVLATF